MQFKNKCYTLEHHNIIQTYLCVNFVTPIHTNFYLRILQLVLTSNINIGYNWIILHFLQTISTVESEFDISAVTEAPETGLSCYTCSASASNKSCYNEPNTNVSLLADVNIPSKQCDISQEFCMVMLTTITE